MELYSCELHHDLHSDKNLLLDDENAILMNDDYKQCARCRKQSHPTNNQQTNNHTNSIPLFNNEEHNWMQIKKNTLISIPINTESRLSINSTDSIDAPLLLNVSATFSLNIVKFSNNSLLSIFNYSQWVSYQKK